MGLTKIRVSSLAELQDLLARREAHPLCFIGVDRVRSAPEIVRLVDNIRNKLVPAAEGEVAIYKYMFGGTGRGHFAKAAGSDVDSSEEEDDLDIDHDSLADDDLGYWVMEGLPSVRLVADIGNIAVEMSDDVLPALRAAPGDLDNLKRLHQFGVDFRRAGRAEAGAAGARAILVGKKAKKLVNRALRYRHKRRLRPATGRASYVADRLAGLVAQVEALLETSVRF